MGHTGKLVVAALVFVLGGCATNSASSLIKASGTSPPQLPGTEVVRNELAGRAFQLGRVYPALLHDDPKQRLNVSAESIAALFERPLRQGFEAAQLGQGKEPPYTINYAIEQITLRQGITMMPNVFLVRMEILRPDNSRVMSAEFQSRYLDAFPVFMSGVVGMLPGYNSPLTALSQMLPATAVVTTRTAAGLQQGKTPDQIEIYPEAGMGGGIISPAALFLKDKPYGICPLTSADLADVAREISAGN